MDRNGERYVELLKRTLCYAYWEDPGMPLSARSYKRGRLRRAATRWLEAALDRAACPARWCRSRRAAGGRKGY